MLQKRGQNGLKDLKARAARSHVGQRRQLGPRRIEFDDSHTSDAGKRLRRAHVTRNRCKDAGPVLRVAENERVLRDGDFHHVLARLEQDARAGKYRLLKCEIGKSGFGA